MSRDLVNGIPYAYKSDNARHDACIPMERRQEAAAQRVGDGKRPPTSWDELRHDFITQDKIHTLRVDKEVEAVKAWKVNWGFLADFDPKGNPVIHEQLPDHLSRFSESVPNTNSGNYGSRVQSTLGQQVNNLEWRLIGSHGKRKIDQEINCNY